MFSRKINIRGKARTFQLFFFFVPHLALRDRKRARTRLTLDYPLGSFVTVDPWQSRKRKFTYFQNSLNFWPDVV